MDSIDALQGAIFLLAGLVLVLAAVIFYFIGLLARVETTLWRLSRPPQVPRDLNGHRTRERV